MKIGYARVSSNDQDLQLQIDQLMRLGCDKVFAEKVSGKSLNRPKLNELMSFAREGDTIIVTKTDRLARNTIDALNIAQQLKKAAIGLKLLDLGDIDINSDLGHVIFTVMSTFAELERKRINQRRQEGQDKARAEGKHLGRYKNTELRARIEKLLKSGLSKHSIAKQLNCSRTTVYSVAKELVLKTAKRPT
ncbi:recombinase family protein [Thalassotalea ponticola]|uniref:recombinase family protein n=1 Tax=Thalassotalea ponticola TaxID=1523392 RepID=UPI0025B5E466|nr:recombinase family protein [Thalassotalea ponticola]MDN3652752.1 recombinase family protein [Thalassotalea ponticola]